MHLGKTKRISESGNVLFLILIAVALFAALSYAVTQSMRSGSGDASKETNSVNVAQLLQVPTTYRTAVQRMVVSNDMEASLIRAIEPAYFSSETEEEHKRNIYHPLGGGMPYPVPPKDLMNPDYEPYAWAFNSENEVKNVGITSSSGDAEEPSVELMALLPGIKKSACEAINQKLGITGMPESVADASLNASSTVPAYMENGGAGIIGAYPRDEQLAGKQEGCFLLLGTTDEYVFYAVVLAR